MVDFDSVVNSTSAVEKEKNFATFKEEAKKKEENQKQFQPQAA